MSQINEKQSLNIEAEENVLFGVVGAFLFSLVGGVMYILLSMVGFIAALSGLVGVVCAIKGYAFFSKKESKKGIIISVIISALVLVLAWYVGFCLDMVEAYKLWYAEGEVDYAPTFFEYFPFGVIDLTVNTLYFVDLFLSLALGAVGCASYVSNRLKRQKAIAAAEKLAQDIANEDGGEFKEASDESAESDDPFAYYNSEEQSSDDQK